MTRHHRHDDPKWADEVISRWRRRKYGLQQREKAWADLKAAVGSEILEPIAKAMLWVQRRLHR